LFSDKGFADGKNVAQSSGSVAVVIVVSVIAMTIAGKKRAGNNAGQQTSVTENPLKQDLIKGIDNEPIGNAW
jgi:hypothetical protein